jgi:hypothetical protein
MAHSSTLLLRSSKYRGQRREIAIPIISLTPLRDLIAILIYQLGDQPDFPNERLVPGKYKLPK